MNYLYAGCATLIVFFIVQILRKPGKIVADYLLIAINLTIGLFLLADVLVTQQLTSSRIILQNAVPLFLFPLFVMYVLQFIRSREGIAWTWHLIFLPGVAFVAFSTLDHFVFGHYDQAALMEHFNQPSLIYQFFFKGNQLLFIGILIWLLWQLKDFDGALKQGYSDIETVSVEWLRNFTVIYLASILITFLLFLSQNLGWLGYEIKEVFGVVYGLLVFSVFYLNYEGIRHYTLAQEYSREALPLVEEAGSPPVADLEQDGSLPDEKDRAVHQRMLSLFSEKQVYLTPKYGLRELADNLGESRHLVSRIINTLEGKSFYDLVNQYRVAHLKKLLDDPANDHLTILALGLESGFNSKASINRIFKSISGLTPREYLQQRAQRIGSDLE
jgi:AraC-like DNA-binding protein